MIIDDLIPPFELLDGHFKKTLTPEQENELKSWVDATADNRAIFDHHKVMNAIDAMGAKVVSINNRPEPWSVEKIIELGKIDAEMQKLGALVMTTIDDGAEFFIYKKQKFIVMPLPKAKGNSKKSVNKQVSKNIRELVHHGTKQRPMKQIIAIAEATARGRKTKKKNK